MLAAAALLGWAALLAVAAQRPLRHLTWTSRAPRLTLILWQAASVSFLTALVLGGLALAVPTTVLSHGLADLLTNCVMAVRDAYRTPAGAGAAGAGLVLAAGVTARAITCLCRGLRAPVRRRRRHAAALALVARHDPHLGVLVVDHPDARAYCLPGRHPTIVITTGTLARLQPDELEAVLAHEREHLTARHHLAVGAAAALAHAFPRVPLLREAAAAIPALAEMAADDAAARGSGATRVAAALAHLAGAVTPSAALGVTGAGGGNALGRVKRLLRPAAPLGRAATAAALTTAGLLLLAPALVALAPAAAAGTMSDCRMPMTATHHR